MNVFRPISNRLATTDELRYTLAHELFHVAGAFHVCGGGLGENPFGFSQTNCPYPESLMANFKVVTSLSPEDLLASCIIYHPGTQPVNAFPDTT